MSGKPIHILIVDDDEDDYIIFRDIIIEIKGQAFSVQWEPDFDTALRTISEGKHDIYFFDYHLGEHNGIELLRTSIANGCKSPMILLTGQGDREIDMEAMRIGAADYLAKGAFDATLLERSIRYAIDRTQTLEALRESQNSLKDANTNLREAMDNIHEEMQIASRLQRSLLPVNLDEIKGIAIAATYLPCEAIGGDLYEVTRLDDNKVLLLILDVSGHGVPAALVTAMTKILFARVMLEERSTSEIFTRINNEIIEILSIENYFTAFLAIYDCTKRELTFTRAGHPLPLLVPAGSDALQNLDTGGMSIGFFADVEFEEKTIPIKKGDKLIMYTDGLPERKNRENKMFGRERIEDIVLKNKDRTVTEIKYILIEENNAYAQNLPQDDDITCLLIEFL
jgi:serine phosphatase RsbU (regulator of sigma subunit)